MTVWLHSKSFDDGALPLAPNSFFCRDKKTESKKTKTVFASHEKPAFDD